MPILKKTLLLIALFVIAVPAISLAASKATHDADALSGLKTAKAVYDVRTKNPKSLLFILKVIEATEKGMRDQGVEPDFILSFRGGTLPLLTRDPKTETEAEKAILTEVRERLGELRDRGMVLEACNVAAGIFKVKQADLADDLTMVGNSLISLVGYQNKGYALVPMY